MHIADLAKGMLGANGIVGGGSAARLRRGADRQDATAPAASPSASSATAPRTRARSTRASTWPRSGSCRSIFVVENNGYAESTAFSYHWSVGDIADRARQRLRHARRGRRRSRFLRRLRGRGRGDRPRPRGDGPTLIECEDIRFYGHFEGDAADLPRARGGRRAHGAATRWTTVPQSRRPRPALLERKATRRHRRRVQASVDRSTTRGAGQGGHGRRPRPRPARPTSTSRY